MKKSKVYIVCEPTAKTPSGEHVRRIDLSPAAEWGEPVVLLSSHQSLLNPDPTVTTLYERLSKFCDDDYLVPIGDPALMCAAAMVAGRINGGRVKLLKWDRFMRKYIPIPLHL